MIRINDTPDHVIKNGYHVFVYHFQLSVIICYHFVIMEYKCACGKIYTQRSNLSRHKAKCSKSIEANQQPMNQLTTIEVMAPAIDVMSDVSSDMSVSLDDNINYRYSNNENNNNNFNSNSNNNNENNNNNRSSEYRFSFPTNKPTTANSTPKLSPKPEIPLYNEIEGCQKLHKQIIKFLEKQDHESALLSGRLIIEDRRMYEKYVNYHLSRLQNEQENALVKKNQLQTETCINADQIETIQNEVSACPDKQSLEKLYLYHKFASEYMFYDAVYNEKFNKTITALHIMKDNVDNYKHLTIQHDMMKEPMSPMKVSQIEEKTKQKLQRQTYFYIFSCSVSVLLFAIITYFFNIVQVIMLFFVCLLVYSIYFFKLNFVDKEKVKLF
jgi:hypothetical protein